MNTRRNFLRTFAAVVGINVLPSLSYVKEIPSIVRGKILKIGKVDYSPDGKLVCISNWHISGCIVGINLGTGNISNELKDNCITFGHNDSTFAGYSIDELREISKRGYV